MLKIRDDVDLKELKKYGFKMEMSIYEKWYKTIGYTIDKDRIIHKLKDMGFYTEERKITKQDIQRLELSNLVVKE
ncbi:hypothetical protein [Gemella morbillorum]